ncbi:MAG: class I SAM-dependent methyltransferase [Candidatus Hodarchaeota archaeon]
MDDVFINSYTDVKRAEAYANLEFSGTYYLAYRDLPDIIFKHVKGTKALDFGCGTGRSTRFLQKIGFETIGVDIAEEMIIKARELDPDGNYCIIKNCDFSELENNYYDLVLSAFTFDNIPTKLKKVKILMEIRRLLNSGGRIVNLVSRPEIYKNEWVSFSTKDFPENEKAKSGEKVKIIITDLEDKRPVEDVIFSDEDYKDVFEKAGLELIKRYKPLAKENRFFDWINETRIAPWIIYVLK